MAKKGVNPFANMKKGPIPPKGGGKGFPPKGGKSGKKAAC